MPFYFRRNRLLEAHVQNKINIDRHSSAEDSFSSDENSTHNEENLKTKQDYPKVQKIGPSKSLKLPDFKEHVKLKAKIGDLAATSKSLSAVPLNNKSEVWEENSGDYQKYLRLLKSL